MTFTPDETLIVRAEHLARTLKGRHRQERIKDLLVEIDEAAEFSRGPLPERNAAWAATRKRKQAQLRVLVERFLPADKVQAQAAEDA